MPNLWLGLSSLVLRLIICHLLRNFSPKVTCRKRKRKWGRRKPGRGRRMRRDAVACMLRLGYVPSVLEGVWFFKILRFPSLAKCCPGSTWIMCMFVVRAIYLSEDTSAHWMGVVAKGRSTVRMSPSISPPLTSFLLLFLPSSFICLQRKPPRMRYPGGATT